MTTGYHVTGHGDRGFADMKEADEAVGFVWKEYFENVVSASPGKNRRPPQPQYFTATCCARIGT